MSRLLSSCVSGRRILLLAQVGSSGGTREYFKSLVHFYTEVDAKLLVALDNSDSDLQELISRLGHESIDFLEFAPRVGPGIREQLRGAVSEGAFNQEREAVRRIVRAQGIDLVVASVGKPGTLLGAVSTGLASIYLLHTYPHGLRARLYQASWVDFSQPSLLIATVSQFSASTIEKSWSLKNKRVDVVYGTVEPSPTRAKEPRHSVSKVLTLGHVERYKDPMTWMQVAERVIAQHPNTKFVWAGEGRLLDRCRARVARLKLDNRIHFKGHVSDIDELFGDSTLYFQPSRIESLGLGILEASSRGVPTVASAIGGIPEIVIHGQTGLLAPARDDRSFALALGHLIGDPISAQLLGQRARERCAKHFSKANWYSRLLGIHERVLQQ